VILLVQVSHTYVVMQVGKLRITPGGLLKLGERLVVFFVIEVGAPHDQVEFRGSLADLCELGDGPFVKFFAARLVRGNTQNVQVVYVERLLSPERLQGINGLRPTLGKEIAEPQEIARLRRIWLISNYRLKRRNGLPEIILPVVGQADVQAYARHLGG